MQNNVQESPPLSAETCSILAASQWNGHNLWTPDETPETTMVLKTLGGVRRSPFQWHFVADPSSFIEMAATLRIIPEVTISYMETPPDVVAVMLEKARLHLLHPYHTLLEPSAGDGLLVRAIRQECPKLHIDVCEIKLECHPALRELGAHVADQDFMHWHPVYTYDRIVMAPPWQVAGDEQAWLTHINHALTMTATDGGFVVSAVPVLVLADTDFAARCRELVPVDNFFGVAVLFPE